MQSSAELSGTIASAIDFVCNVKNAPEQKAQLMHGILSSLEQRKTLDSSSFLEGVVTPDRLIQYWTRSQEMD